MQIGMRALEYEGCLFLKNLHAVIYTLLNTPTTIDNNFLFTAVQMDNKSYFCYKPTLKSSVH